MVNPVLECAIGSNINDARSPQGSQGFDIESHLITVIDSNNHKLTISQGLHAWWGGGVGCWERGIEGRRQTTAYM